LGVRSDTLIRPRCERGRQKDNNMRLMLALTLAFWAACSSPPAPPSAAAEPAASEPQASRKRVIRLVGTTEAVRSFSVGAPRLRGQNQGAPQVITRLLPGGVRVEAGDIVAELDPQEQERVARDRRTSFMDLEGQIRRMQSDQTVIRARDDTQIIEAKSEVERTRLAVTTNDLLPKLDAERNLLAYEQAQARLAELQRTYDLKRKAAAAELRILEIRRDRAEQEAEYAEQNVGLMAMSAPFAGIVVLKTTNRQGQMVELQEGDETRPGMPIMDVIDPTSMRVRVQINQGDVGLIQIGQRARVLLDAYPELSFEGRVEQIAPVAVPSAFTAQVRTFVGVVSVQGSHEKLMPDLTAAVEIAVEENGEL
jgi:multidrug efflux pump subunit AcrA (membrane-fusion protein)